MYRTRLRYRLSEGQSRTPFRRLWAAGQLDVPSRPDEAKPASKIEAVYHKADRAIQGVLDLLAA